LPVSLSAADFAAGEGAMFAGIENIHPDPRRGWTALASFTLQAMLLAIAVAIPLLYPSSVPNFERRIFVPMTTPPPDVVPAHADPAGGHTGVNASVHVLMVNPNPRLPFAERQIDTGAEGPPDPANFDVGTGLYSGPYGPTGPRVGDQPLPRPPVPAAPPRVSRPMQGYLLHRVEPVYPPIAMTAGVQGAVVIKAIISREGTIEHLQVINGSPLLSKAAIDAIVQWRYRPYLLNDQAVEVETEITVNFYLHR
jgi:protein TonB